MVSPAHLIGRGGRGLAEEQVFGHDGRGVSHRGAFDFFALGATGHGLLQARPLPAAQQGGRDTLGTGYIRLPSPSGYLADALGFVSDS